VEIDQLLSIFYMYMLIFSFTLLHKFWHGVSYYAIWDYDGLHTFPDTFRMLTYTRVFLRESIR